MTTGCRNTLSISGLIFFIAEEVVATITTGHTLSDTDVIISLKLLATLGSCPMPSLSLPKASMFLNTNKQGDTLEP